MTFDDEMADPKRRFATVSMTDAPGLLRGQMVSVASPKGIARNGMGMAPAQPSLDPTDVLQTRPGVNDDTGDFHDDPLQPDPATLRLLPWSRQGHDLLVLPNFTGESARMCPRSILKSVLARAAEAGLVPTYGRELECILFDETPETARATGYRNLTPATRQASHDLTICQALQSEWSEAVSDLSDPLRIDLAKMPEDIGAGFMGACIGAGEGTEPAVQPVLLKNFIPALSLRQGTSVTFMPRWNEQADSRSIHLPVDPPACQPEEQDGKVPVP